VQQMLTLSRLESGAAPALVPVDLAALVRREVAELAPAAIAKRQTIEVDAPASCTARGDATLLSVLVRNLVDNALRYSPADAVVRVSVVREAPYARLTVEDSGAGMSDADQRRLGERFFRVLGSAQGGSGLGWSIVQRIASVHRAEVRTSRSAALGGLQVVVDWAGA